MGKAYNEIMDKIEVTEEMRERVLSNIESTQKSVRPKAAPRYAWRNYLGTAVCLLLIAVCAVTLPRLLQEDQNQPGPLAGSNGSISKVSSEEELAKYVGFTFDVPKYLPFTAQSVSYISLWGTTAEIRYAGDDQHCTYRVSKGSGDNSGDFSVYETVTSLELDTFTAELKGNSSLYNLVLWENNGYAYSLKFENGISDDEIRKIFE